VRQVCFEIVPRSGKREGQKMFIWLRYLISCHVCLLSPRRRLHQEFRTTAHQGVSDLRIVDNFSSLYDV
jgi:hypothetical protein